MQPETLGRYRIVRELGRGAMGQVWLAHDPELDREVAIKTVQRFASLPEAERAEARERFLREARAAARLAHGGIVTVFDVGDADGLLYMAMEYIDGPTLDAFARPDALLPPDVVVDMIAGVAEALAYAHGRGIVHRDVKPANLMRVGERTAKIMDFGLARPSEGQLTRDGALLGSPSYMAPEQIRGGAVDGRSDLFALGVVLYELLTGDKPFPGDSVSSIIYRIVNEPLRDPLDTKRPVTDELRGVLERALAKRPEDRFQDGDAFAAALREAAGRGGPAPVPPAAEDDPPAALPPPPPPPGRRRPRRTSPWPVVAAIVVVLAGAAGAAWAFRDRLPWLQSWLESLEPAPAVWQTVVTTDPPGLDVTVDGAPLPADGVVRFSEDGPFPTLVVESGCRRIERPLTPADAGGEVVLVPDPTELEWTVDPGVEGAVVRMNGERVGTAPVGLTIDLCRDTLVQVDAEGYREASVEIVSGSTPLEARTGLAELSLARIPVGTLVLPAGDVPLAWYVDGRRIGLAPQELELPAGEYRVRAVNQTYWIDVSGSLTVEGDRRATATLPVPPLATLVVQAYPPNCAVELRRPGGAWTKLDETPLRTRVAAGNYEVRVTLNTSGESTVRAVELSAGENPPVRVSFGAGS